MNLLIPVLGIGALAFLAVKKSNDDAAIKAATAKASTEKAAADKFAADKAAADKLATEKAMADKAEADRLAGMALSSAGKDVKADPKPSLKLKKDTDPLGLDKVMCLDLAGLATPFKYQKLWMGKNGSPIGPTVSVYLLNNPKAAKEDFDLLMSMLAEEESLRPIFYESAAVTDDIRKLRVCLVSEKARRFP